MNEDLSEPKGPPPRHPCASRRRRPAIAKAITQLDELSKAYVEHLLAAEPRFKQRPERLGGEHVLQRAEVLILQLAGQGVVVAVSHARIPASYNCDSLADLGVHMG